MEHSRYAILIGRLEVVGRCLAQFDVLRAWLWLPVAVHVQEGLLGSVRGRDCGQLILLRDRIDLAGIFVCVGIIEVLPTELKLRKVRAQRVGREACLPTGPQDALVDEYIVVLDVSVLWIERVVSTRKR